MRSKGGVVSTSQLMLQYLLALDELRDSAPVVRNLEWYARADSNGRPFAPEANALSS